MNTLVQCIVGKRNRLILLCYSSIIHQISFPSPFHRARTVFSRRRYQANKRFKRKTWKFIALSHNRSRKTAHLRFSIHESWLAIVRVKSVFAGILPVLIKHENTLSIDRKAEHCEPNNHKSCFAFFSLKSFFGSGFLRLLLCTSFSFLGL